MNAMNKIQNAINFSIAAHSGQTRKGKDIPYITHPLTVALILSQTGASDDVVIAGILHDTMEDSGVTKDDIAQNFGENVAGLVYAVSEKDKSLPWMERKMAALAEMDTMSQGALLLKSADVLCNMTDICKDYREKGEAMFASFNAGKDDHLTRYTKVVKKMEEIYPSNLLLPDLKITLNDLTELFQTK